MYAIMRFKKLKSWGEIGGVAAHHRRDRLTPNAGTTVPNLWLKQPAGGIVEGVRDRLSGIKIRKNGVLAYEFLLTASPEFFRWEDEISHRRVTDFNKKVMTWLKETFGYTNVISAICHLDEQTPHLHVTITPIDDRGRLNACHWTGDKKKLQQLQDSFAEKLAPLGLERGIKGSRASHTRISEYYSSVNNSVPPALPEIKVDPPPFLLTESSREDWAESESQRLNQEIWPRLQPLADRSSALKLEKKRREELEVLLLESRKKSETQAMQRKLRQEDAATRRKAHYFDFLATYAPETLSAALLTAQETCQARQATSPHADAGSESRVDLLG